MRKASAFRFSPPRGAEENLTVNLPRAVGLAELLREAGWPGHNSICAGYLVTKFPVMWLR